MPEIKRKTKKFKAELNGKTIEAETYEELQEKMKQIKEQQDSEPSYLKG